MGAHVPTCEAPPPTKTTPPGRPRRAPRAETVLAVDDEPTIRQLLRTALEGLGFRVLLADSGARALEIIETEPFDLALVDMSMPGMSGEALLAALAQRFPQTPFIAMSGHGEDELRERMAAAGLSVTLLAKPFGLHDLDAAVEGALARRAPGPA